MKSVLNQLFTNMNINPNSANNSISKILMKCYSTKEVPSIKELSNLSNVAESTITKFAISLGYKGYRELVFKIKLEISDREHQQKLEIGNKSFSDFEEKVIYAIRELRYFENKIMSAKKSIKKAKNVFLFSSYQFQNDSIFLAELLRRNKIECSYSTQMFDQLLMANKVAKDDFSIFIIGGQDTKTIELILKEFKQDNCLVLATHSKVNEVSTRFKTICIDSKQLKHLYEYRTLILKYISLQLVN
ncbi:hypothetical protein [Spiroplasma diminutum]|uniref:HTH rpiR-type domain-containing protein n=1 Tax=Spiroplasma diminutum CUAS-1 TaxID=1276221 RepID=S5MJW3_9MOLU|nr:hypothetical protein [Spiroplasma diminutum]AGR42245.1 hypothetical protein SDIMI_v3c05410 [Spiroplasma diminutum CUAS-1]